MRLGFSTSVSTVNQPRVRCRLPDGEAMGISKLGIEFSLEGPCNFYELTSQDWLLEPISCQSLYRYRYILSQS